MTTELTEFEKRLAEKLREKPLGPTVREEAKPTISTADFEDAVPDIDLGHLSPEEEAIDRAIETLPILDAYSKWCGKSRPRVAKGQTESIKISCPNPQHPDKNPSAWVNTAKNLYHCEKCSQGGDVWDIAAYHFGYPVPAYKRDKTMFRGLREKIAVDLGFEITRGLTQTFVTVPPQPGAEDSNDEGTEDEAAPSNVVVLPTAFNAQAEETLNRALDYPSIEWRAIVPAGTFLDAWMQATTLDTCPEEFHFWTGLMAIGTAVGLNRQLRHEPHVKANLFVSLLGPSGTGKSRAKRHLKKIINEVMPYDYENPAFNTGTKAKDGVGSAEFVQQLFVNAFDDPSRPGHKVLSPVRCVLDYDEMAALVTLATRQGNPLKEMLQGIYDCPPRLETGSMKTGDRIADSPFGQLISSTQNASLKHLFSGRDDSSGFMNRWVFAGGKPKPPDPFGGPGVDLSVAQPLLKVIWMESSKGSVIMDWDDAVRPEWADYFTNVLVPLKEASERKGTFMLQRLDLLMMKLCLLFACNMNQTSITVEALDQAKALLPYLLKTYGTLDRDMSQTESNEQVDELIAGIRELTQIKGRSPNTSEIYFAVGRRKIFGKLTSPQFKEFMRSLSDMGLIAEVQLPRSSAKGRVPTGWVVNE